MLPLKYNYSSGKMKGKMHVAFTTMQFNGRDKKESRKCGCHYNMHLWKTRVLLPR